MKQYTQSSFYIDSDDELVQTYANKVTNGITERTEQVQALFMAVRDDYYYNPYELDLSPKGMKASTILKKDTAYCIEKATPAFNKELCKKLNVGVLDFDGENDAIFQPFSEDGGKFMEYTHEYGEFDDLPYELMLQEFKKYYGHLWNGDSFQISIN